MGIPQKGIRTLRSAQKVAHHIPPPSPQQPSILPPPAHTRTFDDVERGGVEVGVGPRLLCVLHDVLVDALDERVLEPLLDILVPANVELSCENCVENVARLSRKSLPTKPSINKVVG